LDRITESFNDDARVLAQIVVIDDGRRDKMLATKIECNLIYEGTPSI
jgi:hypothetical protein